MLASAVTEACSTSFIEVLLVSVLLLPSLLLLHAHWCVDAFAALCNVLMLLCRSSLFRTCPDAILEHDDAADLACELPPGGLSMPVVLNPHVAHSMPCPCSQSLGRRRRWASKVVHYMNLGSLAHSSGPSALCSTAPLLQGRFRRRRHLQPPPAPPQ